MGEEITSPNLLISLLVQLREENRQLSAELSTAKLMLRTLESGAAVANSDEAMPPAAGLDPQG